MKLAIALLLIGTALGTGAAALAAGHGQPSSPHAVPYPAAKPDAMLNLIDFDEDDDDGGWLWPKSHDGDDDCEEEEGGDEDGGCDAGSNGNAAASGTVTPPKNGLFTDGTAPKVKSN